MKWSKGLTVTTAFAMAFSLAACGSSKTTDNAADKPKDSAQTTAPAASTDAAKADADKGLKPEAGAKLVVWEAKEWRPFVEEIAKQFTAKYGVEVKMDEVGGGDAVKKLTNDGPAGIAGDVVMFPHDQLGQAVAAGLVLPNDTFADEAKKENADPAIVASSYGGTLYGFPRSVETYAMFYNKDLIPTPPKTWDEVKAFAAKFNDPKANKYAYMWDIGNFYFSYPFLATTGGYVFGKNGTDKADIGLNNAGAVEGATFFESLKKDVLPLKSGDVNYDIKKGLFTGGTLAMNVDGPWAVADIKKSGIKFGVAPLPSINGKPAVSFSGVKAWYVNSFTKYPNAAKLFARFASTKEAQLLEFKLNGTLPSNKEVANDAAVKNDEITVGFLQQFQNSQPMPSIPEMGSIWDPIGGALGLMWNDGKAPKEALDTAVKNIQDQINGAKK